MLKSENRLILRLLIRIVLKGFDIFRLQLRRLRQQEFGESGRLPIADLIDVPKHRLQVEVVLLGRMRVAFILLGSAGYRKAPDLIPLLDR